MIFVEEGLKREPIRGWVWDGAWVYKLTCPPTLLTSRHKHKCSHSLKSQQQSFMAGLDRSSFSKSGEPFLDVVRAVCLKALKSKPSWARSMICLAIFSGLENIGQVTKCDPASIVGSTSKNRVILGSCGHLAAVSLQISCGT